MSGYIADRESAMPRPGQIGFGQVDTGPAAPVEAEAAAEVPGPPTEASAEAAAAREPAPAAEVPAAPAPVACAMTSRTLAHAPDGTPDSRTTVGTCETLEFSIGGQVADWVASSGAPTPVHGQAAFRWAAPDRAAVSTITATLPATGQTCSMTINVVAPAEIRMRKDSELAFPAGSAGAGMRLEVRAYPRSVNFGWAALKEDPGPASDVTGYFTARQAAGADLSHHPNPAFVRFGWNNTIRFDTAAAGPGALPPPWSAGSFRWRIPNRYRCTWSTGAGHAFAHAVQGFAITAGGRVTVTKQGQSVSRSP